MLRRNFDALAVLVIGVALMAFDGLPRLHERLVPAMLRSQVAPPIQVWRIPSIGHVGVVRRQHRRPLLDVFKHHPLV